MIERTMQYVFVKCIIGYCVNGMEIRIFEKPIKLEQKMALAYNE